MMQMDINWISMDTLDMQQRWDARAALFNALNGYVDICEHL